MQTIPGWHHVLKVPRSKANELLVLQVPSGANNQIAWRKSLPIKSDHRITFKFLYRIAGPKDRLSQWMILPEILGEDFMHQVIGAVFIHFYFFQDYAPFTANVLAIEHRIQYQVAEYIHRDRKMLIE